MTKTQFIALFTTLATFIAGALTGSGYIPLESKEGFIAALVAAGSLAYSLYTGRREGLQDAVAKHSDVKAVVKNDGTSIIESGSGGTVKVQTDNVDLK